MSSGEKTEQPTSKKLRDARQKGQVAQSKDVSSTALLVLLLAYLFIFGPYIFEQLKELVGLPARYYDADYSIALEEVSNATVSRILTISLPIAGIVVVGGLFINYIQIGPLFVMEPLKPDLKKINPVDKVKQMFSMKNLIEFLKSCIKVGFLGILIYLLLKNSLGELIKTPYSGIDGAIRILKTILFQLSILTVLAYVIIAAADLFFQRWQHIKQLKMTKDEVKREYKEMEGDPTIKGKRKQLHQEMVMQDTVSNTRKASVLVTNPTHKAIAIYYKEGETKLPMVLAKGQGILAERMIQAAKEEGIPIMQNVPLARELFENTELEHYIPMEFIEPVAEVLRWVRQLQQEPPY